MTLPLVFMVFHKRIRPMHAFALALLVIGAGIALRLYLWSNYVSTNSISMHRQYFHKLYYPTFTRLDGLILGVSIAYEKNFRRPSWESLAGCGNLLLLVGLALVIYVATLQSDKFNGKIQLSDLLSAHSVSQRYSWQLSTLRQF